jgi:hypothetical protein
MEPSIEEHMASLRRVRLPRLQKAILKNMGEGALRKMLVALTPRSRAQQEALIIKVVEDSSIDPPDPPFAEADSIEAHFAIICSPILPSHRLSILKDYEDAEVMQLLAAALESLRFANLQAFVLGLLGHDGVRDVAPDATTSSENRRAPAASLPDGLQDTKHILASMEYDDDEPRLQRGANKRCAAEDTRPAKRRKTVPKENDL